MSDLQPIDRPGMSPPQEAPQRCRYCGAPLSGFFYFCLGCGTPYKSIDTVVTAAAPRPLTDGELIQLKAPSVWPIFWTYLGVIVFGAVVAALAFGEDRPDLALSLETGFIFITTCVLAVMYWRSLASQLMRPGFTRPAAWAAILMLVPTLMVNFGLTHALRWMLQGVVEADRLDPMTRLRQVGVSEAALVVMFCVFPAVTEEIAFRGLVQHWLQVAIRPWRALVLASFLFAALHFNVLLFPYLFAVGMLLGWAKWKTGSLYPSMLIHFLHNLVVIELF
jgi:CAAX protease family protein